MREADLAIVPHLNMVEKGVRWMAQAPLNLKCVILIHVQYPVAGVRLAIGVPVPQAAAEVNMNEPDLATVRCPPTEDRNVHWMARVALNLKLATRMSAHLRDAQVISTSVQMMLKSAFHLCNNATTPMTVVTIKMNRDAMKSAPPSTPIGVRMVEVICGIWTGIHFTAAARAML